MKINQKELKPGKWKESNMIIITTQDKDKIRKESNDRKIWPKLNLSIDRWWWWWKMDCIRLTFFWIQTTLPHILYLYFFFCDSRNHSCCFSEIFTTQIMKKLSRDIVVVMTETDEDDEKKNKQINKKYLEGKIRFYCIIFIIVL